MVTSFFRTAVCKQNFNRLFILFICLGIFSSCAKHSGYLRDFNRPNAECVIVYTEDDAYGDILDFVYDRNGKLVEVNAPGVPGTMTYDAKGRLLYAKWPAAGSTFEFSYKDATFLPSRMQYLNPDYGGLLTTDSFFHDRYGRMIKHVYMSENNSQYNHTKLYEYDNNHNVTRVTTMASHGGTEFSQTGFTKFQAVTYDNKPNFLAGNQWIKYLLMYTSFDENEMWMHSANNPLKWIWNDGFHGEWPTEINTEIEYNDKGFALHLRQDYSDPGDSEPWFTINRTSYSSCDIKPADKGRASGRLMAPRSDDRRKKVRSMEPSPFGR